MEKEVWKKIHGFSNYSVSNYGNVRNDENEKLLKPQHMANGYFVVRIRCDETNGKRSEPSSYKTLSVHRLVAEAFIPQTSILMNQVSHKDKDKSNNRANNLIWASSHELKRNELSDRGALISSLQRKLRNTANTVIPADWKYSDTNKAVEDFIMRFEAFCKTKGNIIEVR